MSVDVKELGARPSERSPLLTAIVRFLLKFGFFTAMIALGMIGIRWLPNNPHDPPVTPTDLVVATIGFCLFLLFFVGTAGLAVTVFTGGRAPRWE